MTFKVVIFGSTGNTGLCAVSAAIDAGYEITAFVRDESKLSVDLKPRSVIQGDVMNKSDVEKAVQGQDAVVIILGTRNELSPTTVLSDGTKNILEAMAAQGVKRVACCLSSFLFWDKTKIPPRLMNVHEEHERMLEALKNSDREWIAVCPPHISDNSARGDFILENDKPVGREISKHDLGKIIVDCVKDDNCVGHLVAMGYPA